VKVVMGARVIERRDDEIVVRQRLKILDDAGNLVKAPMVTVREKKRHENESQKDVKKRAVEKLEQKIQKFKNELMKGAYGVVE